jgi:hypothetical protein
VRNWDNRQKLIDLAQLPTEVSDVELEIHKRLSAADRAKCNRSDIRVSVPDIPPISGNALIQTSKSADIHHVEEYFPVKQWTDAYAHNKWRSYVYAPREVAQPVRDAAISVLSDRFSMAVDVDKSNQTCRP